MAITKAKKQEIIGKVSAIKDEAKTLVFVGFGGVTVGETTAMRNTLREEGVGYLVAKKTLMRRGLQGAYEGEMPEMDGEVALAYSTDPIAPAQNVQAFAKQYGDRVTILGGVFEGMYKNKEEMTEIASIPSLQVLRGMFVNVINSPIQGLAVALDQIAEKKSA